MTAITFAPAKPAGSLWRTFLTALRRLHEAQQARRVATELQRFTDYQLADLGLTRGDIQAVARGDLRR